MSAKRLYFLKQLKRAGCLTNNFSIFNYLTVIRPVLEYCTQSGIVSSLDHRLNS